MDTQNNVGVDQDAKDRATLEMALKLYARDVQNDEHNRNATAHDARYLAGDQWEAKDKALRGDRPTFTFNRLIQSRNQIAGEMKQNQWAVKVVPVDDISDPKLAKVLDACVRHIEYSSRARFHYSAAGTSSASVGVGYVRMKLDYLDDESLEQEIIIEPIQDPLSVVIDSMSVDPTGADANHAFKTALWDIDVFKLKYPDAPVSDWINKDLTNDTRRHWFNGNSIRVAEFYQVETRKRRIVRMENGQTINSEMTVEDGLSEGMFDAVWAASPPNMRRESEVRTINHYVMVADKILERSVWPGKRIPVFRCEGDTIHLGESIARMSAIRHAKESQRAYNIARSAQIEEKGLTGKAPILATAEQIPEAQRPAWEKMNSEHPSMLLYNRDPLAPADKPAYLVPPSSSANWAQELSFAAEDIKATTGIYDAAMGATSNETSGRAIDARTAQGRNATFVFTDNLTHMIEEVAKEMIGLIPQVYNEERVVKIYGEDGNYTDSKTVMDFLEPSEEEIRDYQMQVQAYEAGQIAKAPEMPQQLSWEDIKAGRYDVIVDVGQAYASRRAEAANRFIDLVRAIPVIGEFAAHKIVEFQDIPKADELAEIVREGLIRSGRIEDPKQKDMPKEPSPMEVAQLRAMEADAESKELMNVKTALETFLTQPSPEFMELIQNAVTTALKNKEDMLNDPRDQYPGGDSGPDGFDTGSYAGDASDAYV